MSKNYNTILGLNTLIKDDNREMHPFTLDYLTQKDAAALPNYLAQNEGMPSQPISSQGNNQQTVSLQMPPSLPEQSPAQCLVPNVPMPYSLVLTDHQRDMMLAAKIQMEKEEYKQSLRIEENEKKEKLKEQAENRRAEKARKKEFEQISICEDAEGYLRIQSRIPDEKDLFSGRIFQERHIKLFNIVSSEPICKMQMVVWDGLKSFILLVGKECSDRGLAKKLLENGVSPCLARDKKRQVMKLVYAHLVKEADVCYMKRYYGWCKTDHGWEFAAEGEMTVQSILDEYMSKKEG